MRPGYKVPPVTRPRGCHVPNTSVNDVEPLGGEENRRTIIEPIPEAVKAMLYQVFRGTKIEPRVDCRDCQP